MPICKICRKPVTSGVMVHSKCYEKLNNFDNTQSKLLLIKISELKKEIVELKAKLEKAVELPCKVGDTLYTNFSMQGDYFKKKNRPYSCKVIFIGINGGECFANIEYINGRQYQFFFKDFSKTVFLTRKAAEQALKELKSKIQSGELMCK